MKRTALLTFLLLIGFLFTPSLSQNIYAAGGGCEDAQAQSITGTNDFASFEAPSGQVVTSVCVKSSTSHATFNSNTSNGCYNISGIGTQTVNVTRVDSGSSCQEISHIDAYYGSSPTPTETPILTPTPTLTEENPSATPASEVITPTETPTSNSSTQSNQSTNNTTQSSENSSPTSSPASPTTTSPTLTPTPAQGVLGIAKRILPETGIRLPLLLAIAAIIITGTGTLALGLYKKYIQKDNS